MSKDYSTFDIEDFAFDETFQQWVLEAQSPHRFFWEKYIASHPHQTDKILAARALVADLKASPASLPDRELSVSVWKNVQQRIQPPRRVIWQQWSVWRVAASVSFLVLLSASLWWWQSYKTTDTTSFAFAEWNREGLLEEVNHTHKTVKIHLSDGSTVSLEKGSRLAYPAQFDARERVVYLSGEAVFDVKKNPKQPFLVYANETVTKVLGTSFRISAFSHTPKVIVAVRTGRVSVFSKKEYEQNSVQKQPAGLVLTPNQQAIYHREQRQLNKTLVAQPVILTEPTQIPSFEFDNTPFYKVIGTLEKAYGVDIVYDSEVFTHRSLTVSLEDESLFEKLDVICKTMGVTYQVVDAQIIIENQSVRK